jgi:hypothetical protein
MFEFGRELKRLFQADGPRDGLTGGDAALLELLDLNLLRAEARAADIAAGRVSAKDPAQRRLEAAMVWRELARRTGDLAILRKAAAAAETAAAEFERQGQPQRWARARCEQALTALLGTALTGDEGLNAAADVALAEAERAAGTDIAASLVAAGRAMVEARVMLSAGERDLAVRAAARFDGPIVALEAHGRRRAAIRLLAAGVRADRAEMLIGCGLRLKDPMLLRMALDGLSRAASSLDVAYEPLSWARVAGLQGIARAGLAELDCDIAAIAEAVSALAGVLEHLSRDHSPLDWTNAQLALAGALQTLGEMVECDQAFDQAVGCYDRALTVLDRDQALRQRANAAHQRAVCLVRRAELRADLAGLAEAETAFRAELIAARPGRDPVAWAVLQLNYGRLYEARAHIAGWRRSDRKAAALALSAALEVFGEHGLRTLADAAARGLERLRPGAPSHLPG